MEQISSNMGNYHYKRKKKYGENSPLTNAIDNDYFGAMAALDGGNRIAVYVEGYEDIAFWRNIFDRFTTPSRKFQIMTPARSDLAKGKKVVLGFVEKSGANLLLCVDSDFDNLFPNANAQANKVNNCKFLIQTYAYAIENLQCYPPSLQTVAVKAAKTDREIFNFEKFFVEYSTTIYPVFKWYAWAAREGKPEVFSLADFRNTVKINYLEVSDNGVSTIAWLERGVERRLAALSAHFPYAVDAVNGMDAELLARGVSPEETHFYMQGHTLLDNVVKVVLASVCENLRSIMLRSMDGSRANAMSQRNQISYFNNSLGEIDQLLSDNCGYMQSKFYASIHNRISEILE